jgi:hypothetical protein
MQCGCNRDGQRSKTKCQNNDVYQVMREPLYSDIKYMII